MERPGLLFFGVVMILAGCGGLYLGVIFDPWGTEYERLQRIWDKGEPAPHFELRGNMRTQTRGPSAGSSDYNLTAHFGPVGMSKSVDFDFYGEVDESVPPAIRRRKIGEKKYEYVLNWELEAAKNEAGTSLMITLFALFWLVVGGAILWHRSQQISTMARAQQA